MARVSAGVVVSREKITFKCADGSNSFVKVLRVTNNGTFKIDYPIEVTDATKATCAEGATLEQVQHAFFIAMDKYEKAKRSDKLVILYMVNYENGSGNHSRGISFSSGVAVSLCAAVFNETAMANPDGVTTYTYHHEPCSGLPSVLCPAGRHNLYSGKARAPNQVDCTPDNVAFFVTLSAAMVDLIDKLKALTDSPAAMLLAVERGMPLLPAPERP